jgi:glyoxylase-like metal-dependent hydrolase (beta-lactamase superfamily II)
MIKTIFGNEQYANQYIICRFDQCILIDPSHDLAQLTEIINQRKIMGVLITHAHQDHIDLIGDFECPIYIHEEDAHLLFEDRYNGYDQYKRPFSRKSLNLKLLTDKNRIQLADGYVEVIHTPGHTKGSVCYLYQNHLFTGDTLFKDAVGRHDLYSGSLKALKQSVLKIMSLSNQMKIYPGHDELTTMREEKKNNPFYLKWAKQFNKL